MEGDEDQIYSERALHLMEQFWQESMSRLTWKEGTSWQENSSIQRFQIRRQSRSSLHFGGYGEEVKTIRRFPPSPQSPQIPLCTSRTDMKVEIEVQDLKAAVLIRLILCRDVPCASNDASFCIPDPICSFVWTSPTPLHTAFLVVGLSTYFGLASKDDSKSSEDARGSQLLYSDSF